MGFRSGYDDLIGHLERGLTAMRNRTMLLRAEDNCAFFASCGCGAPATEYYIRDGKGEIKLMRFYTTPSVDTAKQWAKRKAIVRKQNPAVVMLEFDEEAAETIIKRFSNDLVWGQFVINNRNGLDYINAISVKEHNLDARYDITYGRIADYDVRDVAIELADTGEMIQDVNRILNPFYAY